MVTTVQHENGIQARIHQIFLDTLELDVDTETNVIESGILDSVGFVKLLLELEQDFGVRVDVADLQLEDFRSVSSIAKMVAARRA